MTETIATQRLDLIPMTPGFMRASLDQDLREAEKLMPLNLPADWPNEFEDVLTLRLKDLAEEPALQPWMIRGIGLRATGAMVGTIGFHSAPGADYLEPFSPGAVEFGFTVFPPFRRQGFAREAALALMGWARDVHGTQRFVLSIRPDNLPSQALAAQLGFVRIGSHIDEIDGEEDVLEYRRSVDPKPDPTVAD